ncbi:MAG: acyl--CoA ligase [Deltaproteobacteria bacterium]|nr:acyl--CoA ligase [Deltaproteobacteria bacterium]
MANPTLVHHFLESSAQAYPDKIALIHEDVRATYSYINNNANQLAHWLIDQKVATGDRVIIILENSLEYVISYYGILKAGAVVVSLSTDLKPDGLNPLIAEMKPKVIITNHRFERLLQACDPSLIKAPKIIIHNPKSAWPPNDYDIVSFEEIISASQPLNSEPGISEPLVHETNNVDSKAYFTGPESLNPDSLSSIIYTSGSTGKPKGVMLSHKNIVSNTWSICQYLNINHNDIQMVVLPFFYVMGKSLLNTHMAAGATVVLNNKFAFPASVIKQMADENITAFSGVPSTYAYLLHRSPLAKYRDHLPSLRYCSQAGGHMSKQIKQELRQVLPEHTDIYIMYGATEASARLTYLTPELYFEKMESIGKPIPGVTMRILGSDGKDAPHGEIGELVASGANIMQGYWNDSVATRKVLDQNGYHTGDMGHQDKEGFFYVTGRKDNLIKVGGHRINTQEIEDVLMETQMVTEAIVLGFPDKLLGNKLIALVAPKNTDFTESHILGQCLERLPKYKLPSEIKLVKALPKNLSGKIDRSRCFALCA